LSNIVCIELKRRGKEVFYFSGTRECDFIIKDGKSITGAIQVCHELNDKNLERECGGLLEAMESFHLDRASSLQETRNVTGRPVPGRFSLSRYGNGYWKRNCIPFHQEGPDFGPVDRWHGQNAPVHPVSCSGVGCDHT